MQTFFATVVAAVLSLASISAATIDLDGPDAAATPVTLLVQDDNILRA